MDGILSLNLGMGCPIKKRVRFFIVGGSSAQSAEFMNSELLRFVLSYGYVQYS